MYFILFSLLLTLGKDVFPETKAPLKPRYVSGQLYCNACQGMVRELLKKLRHRTSQSDVIASMENLCDMWTYVAYDYPPPEMKKGCQAILSYFAEELEIALMNRFKTEHDVQSEFCHNVTGACVQIWWESIPGQTAKKQRFNEWKKKKDQETTEDSQQIPNESQVQEKSVEDGQNSQVKRDSTTDL